MKALNSADKLEELIAREEVRDVIYRYSHALNRRDWVALADVFWPDGQVEYGLYDDASSGFTPIVRELYENVGIHITQHFIGNIILRIDGDQAVAETYVQALHRIPREGGGCGDLLMGSRYDDRFEKRDGEWRIVFRKVAFDWLREFADSGDWTIGSFGIKKGAGHIAEPAVETWAGLQKVLSRF